MAPRDATVTWNKWYGHCFTFLALGKSNRFSSSLFAVAPVAVAPTAVEVIHAEALDLAALIVCVSSGL